MMLEELNDPFDNVEQLFRNVYALSDPVPELLNLLKAHPTQVSAIDLVMHYTEAVEEDPSRTNALASALVTLRDPQIRPCSMMEVPALWKCSPSNLLTFTLEVC